VQRRTASLVLTSFLVLSLVGSTGSVSAQSSPRLAAADTELAAQTASTPPLPKCANVYLDVKTRFRDLSDWRKTLVDTRQRVGSSYKPKDLVAVSQANIGGSGKVRRVIIDDLTAMASAARKAGKGIAVRSAYRSYSAQQAVFNAWKQSSGLQQALKYSARPGHSEHQLGTTIDFRSASSQKAPWDYSDWATSKPGAWMQQNAWKYGFVMSYPKGKFAKVCYAYEPWHYRYVGRKLAAKIHDSGLTPREYLWRHYESQP
jgi:D-alanyl-D-alanine carboxypeptidase